MLESLPINRVIQGNCIELMREMPDCSLDLIITDPPYGIDKSKIEGDEDMTLYKEAIIQSYRLLKKDRFFVAFCSVSKLDELLRDNPFSYYWLCIHYINNGMVRGGMGFSAFIMAAIFKKGDAKLREQIRDVLETTALKRENHPYEKNIEFLQMLIAATTRENELVLDPFAGSGTSLIAARKLNRKYIGIELEKEYCEIATNRLSNTLPQDKLTTWLDN